MQLNQFRFLIAVDKYGSISKAAQELYISQSTISLSLINLEEELGFVLLNRSKRGVTLTPEGEEVLKRALTIQQALESLREIDSAEDQIIGDVRIGGNSHFGMNIITDMMLQIKPQYEGVRVHAQRDGIKEVLKKIAQNELDLAFINYNDVEALEVVNDLKRSQLEFHKIFSDQLCICTRADHPLQKRDSVRFADVAAYERVTMTTERNPLMARHFGVRFDEERLITLDDVLNLRKYVAATDAIVLMPRNEALRSNQTYSYQLSILEVEDFNIALAGGWVHHSTHEMTAAENCVVNALENVCENYLDMAGLH